MAHRRVRCKYTRHHSCLNYHKTHNSYGCSSDEKYKASKCSTSATPQLESRAYSSRNGRRSQDFCLMGGPGWRHPTLRQSCTRLKLSRAAGDMWALQQSAESERNKNSKKYRWNDIWGRVFVNVVSLKYIGMIILHKCRWNVLHSDGRKQWTVQW